MLTEFERPIYALQILIVNYNSNNKENYCKHITSVFYDFWH